MDMKSNLCGQFQHPNIVVSMPPELEFGANSILSYLEGEVGKERFFALAKPFRWVG